MGVLQAANAGDRIGRWTLIHRLGSGSTGTTWKASDERGRLAAVKLLPTPPGDELRLLSRVCHPSVVSWLGGGGQPRPYLAMELAKGRNLRALLGVEKRDVEKTVQIIATLADALAAVHHMGVIHRDVKPENIVVESLDSAELRLVDFGMSGESHGGTMAYAAPEVLSGEVGGPASDVFSLALVWWELITGKLPRLGTVRDNSDICLVLPDLLHRMLAHDPRARPSSSEVADALVGQGAVLPVPDVTLLERRLHSVHIVLPEVEKMTHRWLAQGGHLVITGARGLGRTWVLDHLEVELAAEGKSWVRWVPTGRPWEPVRSALSDPRLGPPVPLSKEPDPKIRAQLAAADLIDRCPTGLHVLVDRVEDLDGGSRATLEALAESDGVCIAVTGDRRPAWTTVACELRSLTNQELYRLFSLILGAGGDLTPLVQSALDFSGGVPALAIPFLLEVMRAGAVVYRGHRWLVDETRLDEVAAQSDIIAEVEEILSAEEARLGVAVALHGRSVEVSRLTRLLGWTEQRVADVAQGLVDRGWLIRRVTGAGDEVSCSSGAYSGLLKRTTADQASLHCAWVKLLTEEEEVPLERLGWHLVGSGDAALVAQWGPDSVAALQRIDVGDAARLADVMVTLVPTREMEIAWLEALFGAGRGEEVIRLGEELLGEGPYGDQDVGVLLVLSQAYSNFSGDHEAALQRIAMARRVLRDRPVTLRLLRREANALFRAGRPDKAVQVARVVGETEQPESLAELADWLGLYCVWAQAEELVNGVGEALAVLDQVGSRDRLPVVPELGLLEATYGRLLCLDGKYPPAIAAMERASLVDGIPAQDRARFLNNAGILLYTIGSTRSALSKWEQAVLRLERMNSADAMHVWINLCVAFLEIRSWKRSSEAGHRALSLARLHSSALSETRALGNLGDLHMLQEEFPLAMDLFSQSQAVAEQNNFCSELVELSRRRAELAIRRGDVDVLERTQTAVEHAIREREVIARYRAMSLLAVCRARSGEPMDLQSSLQSAEEELVTLRAIRDLMEVRLWFGEAFLSVGDLDACAGQATLVRDHAHRTGSHLLQYRAMDLLSRATQQRSTRRDSLQVLLSLSISLTQERNSQRLLDRIASSALDLLQAERAAVFVVRGDEPQLVASCNQNTTLSRPSMTIVRQVLREGREVLVSDLRDRPELEQIQSVQDLALRSVLCVPLIDRGELLGCIYVDSTWVTSERLRELTQWMRALASHAAVALCNLRHLEEVTELNRAFSRFIPREFLQHLGRGSIVDVEVGDAVSREITVLFSDLRGFTALSEGLTAQETFQFLNDYLACMEPQILAHGDQGMLTADGMRFAVEDSPRT